MSVEMTSLPEPVQELMAALSAQGFRRVAEQYTDRFNLLLEVRDARTRYRFTCDRGQWFVEAGPDIGVFDADIWSALLERTSFSMSLQPLDSQVAYFMSHLDEVAAATDSEISVLQSLQEQRAIELLGPAPNL